MPNSYQVNEEELAELQNATLGGRIKWIRNKASNVNNGLYKQAKVAEDIGITASSLAKLETNFAKNPSLEVLQKLSKYFSVPISAFFDVYYEHPMQPFTIFGSNHKQFDNNPLFQQNYQANIACTIHSLNSEYKVSIDEELHLSALELEEFQEELLFLINKTKRRKENWSKKITALKKIQSTKEKGEANE
ncbi:helix-turn-helix domain-containing protein [Sediminibacillus sp. JSM 1682029]|uniref:helix-turn-helix domain-containing protein n=1 Tax=Sediminibacillus sp. JSM 1682029 TaxID=3229857 RepID=UPI00352461F0